MSCRQIPHPCQTAKRPGALAAEPAAQPGEPLDLCGRSDADLEPDSESTHSVRDCLVKGPAPLAQVGQGGVAGGDADLVAEPLVDFQGPAVEGLGGVVVSPVLGQPAELAIARGHARLVTRPLADLQGLAVEGLGGVVVPAVLGQPAELAVPSPTGPAPRRSTATAARPAPAGPRHFPPDLVPSSGGGLARSDLSALTGAPPLSLAPILSGVCGRNLQTRASADSRDAGADLRSRVYLFAHKTLRSTAEEQLGGELARYREGIHDWIGSYASSGWPDTTPGYAIRGYPRLLAATGNATRLSMLARDPRRHAFLLRATGSNYTALAEIRRAQGLIAGQNVPDLQALVELAVYRHAISIRNQSIPVTLPAVGARLARFDHAEALARAITSPDAQAEALTELASAAAEADAPDRTSRLATDAEALARAMTSPDARTRALTELATAIARAGDPDRACRLAWPLTGR